MDPPDLYVNRPAIKPHPLRPYYTPGLVPNYTSVTANVSSSTPSSLGSEAIGSNAHETLKEYARFAGLKFMTTAVLGPFETGKTLLQVQYLPHEDIEVVAPLASAVPNTAPQVNNRINDFYSSSESDEDDSFFTSNVHLRKTNHGNRSKLPRYNSSYTVRSVYDDTARPLHQLAPIQGGILDAMRDLINNPSEGWRALFKGQYTGWLHGMLQLILQPAIEGSLNDLFDLYDDTIPLIHLERIGPNLATLLGSHVLVGVFLSPLEIARTRLIVQSSAPGVRTYNGLLHCLSSMLQNEGGLRGVYLSQNLIPTILYHLITPLVSSTAPLIIDRLFHVTASDAPIIYGLAELALSTLEVLITLPIETIRKRIQSQVRFKDGRPFNTCVATRPVHYTGFLDAVYKVMKEEGSSANQRKPAKQDGDESAKKAAGWGLQGLYKGFSIQCASNVLSSLGHTLNGIEDDLTK
ncbi:mitochondrial carrier domain-containing protein [Umbelopsis sp. PMI_123]|nr:mitochondrial carrier domain-containing protein [Umbelopsis sp. PMI_123]